MTTSEAHIHVSTELASRYLQQLCKHFAHRIPATCTPEDGRIEFQSGVCLLKAEPDTLHLTVESANDEDLKRTEDVVARHLVRFAFRDVPQITWTGETGTRTFVPAPPQTPPQ